MDGSYHHRRKAEHRDWLRAYKKQCAICGECDPRKLTVLNPDTGRAAGLSEGGWSMPASRRATIADASIILCQRHGHRYRQELRGDLPRES